VNPAISHELLNAANRWRPAVESALILAVFFVAAGDPAPAINEAHWLSRLKHFWDPAWCQGDLFLESPDAHLTIVLLAGWMTRWLSLPAVAWIGRLAAWGLLAWAWQRLSWRVVPAPWCAVLTAALWLVGTEQLHLAGEWVVGGVEAKCFAYGLVLLALRNYVEDRWNWVWVQLGLASAFHALVGGWTVLMLLTIWAIYHRKSISFRTMLPGLAVGGVLALVGVVPPIAMNWGAAPALVNEANQVYVFERLPHHLALLSMKPEWLADRAGRHLLVLLMLAGCTWIVSRPRPLTPKNSLENRDALVRLIRFAWGAATLMAVGFFIEWFWANRPEVAAGLLRYYWFRLTDFAAPMAVALSLGAALAATLRSERCWAPLLLAGLIALPAWLLGGELIRRAQHPTPPADRKMQNLGDWHDACQWAADHTSPKAEFLVPRHTATFKWRTGRAVVVNHKDVPQDAQHLVEWRRRLDDVYQIPTADGEPRTVHSLSQLGSTRLKELAKNYGADFVVTTHYRPVSLPVAYRNETYVIYDLRRAKPDRNVR
jgi:hypothetical protein